MPVSHSARVCSWARQFTHRDPFYPAVQIGIVDMLEKLDEMLGANV